MKKIEYVKVGDYYLPKIKADDLSGLGKYGRMRYEYIKTYNLDFYFVLIQNNRLVAHLLDVDSQANILYERLLEITKKERGITETLKEKDQMKWVQEMNNIVNYINEIILQELIYV